MTVYPKTSYKAYTRMCKTVGRLQSIIRAHHSFVPSSCLVRQDEGPPHTTVLHCERKGQVEPQLDEYVPARQNREAPVYYVPYGRCVY